jgi:uncharacterized repeat protein (TIGR01451 family)
VKKHIILTTSILILAICFAGAVAAETVDDTPATPDNSSTIGSQETPAEDTGVDVTITGQVLKCSDETPFAGATVTVTHEDETLATTNTNSAGQYILNFQTNYTDFKVTATSTGHNSQSKNITINPGTENTVYTTADFTLGVGDTYVFGGWATNPDQYITFPDGTTVNKNDPNTYTNITDGITNVDIGKTVYVADGTYEEDIIINKNLNLVGQSLNTKVGRFGGRPVTINSCTVTITNFTIQNGYLHGESVRGGGIYNQMGDLTLNHCILDNNMLSGWDMENGGTAYGGGICNEMGLLTLNYCTLNNNRTGTDGASYGGGIYNNGTLIINNSTLQGNQITNSCDLGTYSIGYGGGIYNEGDLIIFNSIIQDNYNSITGLYETTALACGGGIYNDGNLIITYSTIQGNFNYANGYYSSGSAYGGGIYNDGALTIAYSTIQNNNNFLNGDATVKHGGGIYNASEEVSFKVNYCRIVGNDPDAIYNSNPEADCMYNWWGCNNPRFDELIQGIPVINTPWLYMTIAADPTTIDNGQESTITVNFNNLYDGENVTPLDPAIGHIPDDTPVTFNTDKGNVGSHSIDKKTTGGIATTTLTTDGTAGVAHVNAVTDGETVNTEVNINKINTETVTTDKNNFAGQNVDLTATVEDNDGNPVNEGQIQFTVNGTNAGTVNVNNGQATLNWTIPLNWTRGDYEILATYLGSDNYLTSQNTATLTVDKIPTARLYLIITPSKKNPKPGDTVTYTLKVGNKGPNTAENVVMTYIIPEGLEFVRAKADVGTWTYDPATRILTWTIGEVPVGDPYMRLNLKILKAGTYIINPQLSTSTYDPTLNQDTETLTVNAASEPVHGKTVGMQTTGIPMTALLLAILMVLGGILSTKK